MMYMREARNYPSFSFFYHY